MIWTEDMIEEAEYYGLSIWVKDGKTWCGDHCSMCDAEFVKEVLPNPKGGSIIPRYCNDCVEEHNIVNENYSE